MRSKVIICLVLSPILGFLSFLIPELFSGSININQASLLSFVGDTFESMLGLPTVFLLIIVGFILGMFEPRVWLLSGIMTIIVFPIATLYELSLYPESHNLWPIEFFFYVALSTPAIVSSYLGKRFKGRRGTPLTN